MKDIKIIDDFLPKIEHQNIYDTLMGSNFPWYFSDRISGAEEESSDLFCYFAHIIYANYNQNSNFFGLVQPILNILKPKALVKIKINFYPRTEQLIKHTFHSDQQYDLKSALYYVNTNDGVTTFRDTGEEVNSVANRLFLFNSHNPHCSSTCTNAKGRITINFNYF